MFSDMHQLGIDAWSADERLRLIEEIWDSLPANYPPEIPESHRHVLDQRIAEAEANPDDGSPWGEALGRLRRTILLLHAIGMKGSVRGSAMSFSTSSTRS